jgi:hypothetical protein
VTYPNPLSNLGRSAKRGSGAGLTSAVNRLRTPPQTSGQHPYCWWDSALVRRVLSTAAFRRSLRTRPGGHLFGCPRPASRRTLSERYPRLRYRRCPCALRSDTQGETGVPLIRFTPATVVMRANPTSHPSFPQQECIASEGFSLLHHSVPIRIERVSDKSQTIPARG